MSKERDKMNGWEFLTFLTLDLSILWFIGKWFDSRQNK